jgi:3',5'-cyclic AMP phosphodiesterase CpdA
MILPAADEIKMAVISDLHAYSDSGDEPAPSYLKIGDPDNEPGRHPITSLTSLLQKEGITAQLVLCPGDLGDRADREGIRYAWNALHAIKTSLGASFLAATTGNHDLDSRQKHNEYDAKAFLQSLTPAYPFDDEISNNEYWSKHFCVKESDWLRLVLLDSCAYHHNSKAELDHGRVASVTISKIEQYLQSAGPKSLSVLLCHHHPQQHSEIDLGEYDWMREGQLLLDMLGSGRYGRWLVVHGHKHHPKLSYASGSATSPVIFSAGSFAAQLYAKLGTNVRNQFYELTFRKSEIERFGLVGTGRSWFWSYGKGWQRSAIDSGLPYRFGFGLRLEPLDAAHMIFSHIDGDVVRWEVLEKKLPQVKFLLPSDLDLTTTELEQNHSREILRDKYNFPLQIGKVV